jgi:transcriptional regulator with XRE-family HTH domain
MAIKAYWRAANFRDPDMITLAKAFKDHKVAVLSRRSAVSTSTLYNWRNGKTRNPQHSTMRAVANALGQDFALIDLPNKQQVIASFAEAFAKRKAKAG